MDCACQWRLWRIKWKRSIDRSNSIGYHMPSWHGHLYDYTYWLFRMPRIAPYCSCDSRVAFLYHTPTFSCQRISKNFPTKMCKINIVTWRTPRSGETPTAYRIYRDAGLTNLAAEIPANQDLEFKDNCHQSHITHIYYLVSVDSCGNQSDPVLVKIKRNHCKISHGPINLHQEL